MEPTEDQSLLKEEIRLRRRAKNKAKKEESKRLREEDVRRKLFEPKDQRVRLISQKEVETYNSARSASNHCNLVRAVPSLTGEFPSLGSVKPRSKADKKANGPLEQLKIKQEVTPSDGFTYLSHHEGSHQETPNIIDQSLVDSLLGVRNPNSDSTLPEIQSTAQNQSVKPKRADPIEIDLQAALQQSKSRITLDNRALRPPGPVKKKPATHLSGNQLDSSNPERNKGKKRENLKPSKPTYLKSVILQDRQARAESRASGILFNNQDGTDMQSETGVVQKDQLITLKKEAGSTEPAIQDVTHNHQSSKMETSPEAGVTLAAIEEGYKCSVIMSEVVPLLTICNENICQKFESSILLDDGIGTSQTTVATSVHSKRFRGYCDHMLSDELDKAVSALIQDIVKFQDRQYFSDPIKAHAKRRFVLGFRESQKFLKLKKLKLLVIAPDLESAPSEGGIDDTVMALKASSASQDVPYVFALSRKLLRRFTNKAVGVRGISCIGIISYEGSQDNFLTIKQILPELRSRYQLLTGHQDMPSPAQEEIVHLEPEKVDDINSQVVASFLEKLSKELENG